MSISVTLIARDEEARLPRCLEALRWASEVVVIVDDRTSDRSAEVATALGARVVVRAFTDYAAQRQFAEDQATGDWVMWMDCDEIVSAPLAAEIQAAAAGSGFDAYRIPRLDWIFGRWIRHGGWYPQYHVRLVRRGLANWSHTVHERQEIPGPVGTLRHPVLHFSHVSVAGWLEKMMRYTTLEAEALARAGRRAGLREIVFEPAAYSFYKYVVQQGWRDGVHGLALAQLMGCYRLIRNLKLWDLGRAASAAKEPPWQGPTSRS